MKNNLLKIASLSALLILSLASCKQDQSIHTSVDELAQSEAKYINIDDVNLSKVYQDEIWIDVKINTNEEALITKCFIINNNEILNELSSESLNPVFEIPITKEMRQSENIKASICTTSAYGNRKEADISLDNINTIERIWPIKVKFAPIIHDLFLNSEGPETIEGYTHNNSLRREKHYVYVLPQNHRGLDVTASIGTPVYAIADGIVTFSGFSSNDETPSSGYGNVVYLSHYEKINELNVETRYAHLSQLFVNSNAEVKKGDLIGLSGNTGGSRIPHLHFEVLINNYAIDPLEFLPDIQFKNTTGTPLGKSNFTQSSLVLWDNMHKNQWSYDIYIQCKHDIVLGENTIKKGTELLLDKRMGKNIFVNYNNKIYETKEEDFIFTY